MNQPQHLTTAFPLAPTWWRAQSWREPGSGVEQMFCAHSWEALVRRAEAAGFDIAFRPDVLEVETDHIAHEPGQLGLDPVVQVASLARSTCRITLIPTFSATFGEPFAVARQLASLEQLSGGRIGWNIVTSLTGDANMHTARAADSQARWRRAAEFVAVVERLRADFPDAGLVADRERGTFTDPGLVRASRHSGEFFQVAGPLTVPAVRPGRLPLLQAGAAPAGRDFAARHADLVFSAWPRLDDAVAFRADLRARAQQAGRDPDAIRVLQGVNLVLADTLASARARHHATISARDRTAGSNGERHWTVVGTPDDAVDQIEQRVSAGALDGFIALPTGGLGSLELLFDAVMPTLALRGLLCPHDDPNPSGRLRCHSTREDLHV